MAENPIDPARFDAEPVPVESIADMVRELEELDTATRLYLAEDSPTCRAIFRRRVLARILENPR